MDRAVYILASATILAFLLWGFLYAVDKIFQMVF